MLPSKWMATFRCRWSECFQSPACPVPQIRAKIGAALASKVFRQRTSDGREAVIVIDANEVTTIVAEYRPIYINGDVSKPGEYPYRPATTARQLVAVAGGYDIMRIRMNNPYLEFSRPESRVWIALDGARQRAGALVAYQDGTRRGDPDQSRRCDGRTDSSIGDFGNRQCRNGIFEDEAE